MSVEDCLCLESLSTIAPCFVEFDNDSGSALALFQAPECEMACKPELACVSGDVPGWETEAKWRPISTWKVHF